MRRHATKRSLWSTSSTEVALPVERLGRLALPVSGGGYFRLYPGMVFRPLARRAIGRRGHFVMYLHSWEFDPGQPRVRSAGLGRTFRHYVNLDRTVPRFRRLVQMLEAIGGRFMMCQFVREVDGRSRVAPERPGEITCKYQ